MLILPSQREVRLVYAGRTASDHAGLVLGGAGVAVLLAAGMRGRRGAGASPAGRTPALLPAALPVVLLVALAALRLVPRPSHAGEAATLYEQASRAYAAEQWEEAAEYARHAVALAPAGDSRRAELLCVRGEALLRAGHAREAVEAFAVVVEDGGGHLAQALHSGALAREASGDPAGAAAWRRRLAEELPETPWARPGS
jgi:tetratricopeptide (TPR) repeat protein